MVKKRFCEFYKNLYWGSSVNNKALVKWKLSHGAGQISVFCVTRALNSKDQLDIIHCAFLKQPFFKEHPSFVYGIATSRDEAVDIVLRISQEASMAGLDGRLLDYLDSRE
ncbi:MAG: hypothetical protein J6O61_00750 [Butyrivibrio sp.]|uniref:hypothetical protein n=1 Tax=Butyrivibrio sp. TaxID=28121 RepID=UPI001B1A7F4E|nr:hypothetical protein [Butyrivibrio sp.]MBO6239390.1 hypothetical protein [Butyrivibrio sp.]